MLPSLAKNKPKVPLLPHQIPPVGTSPIILRGLTGGLRSSLKTIKQLISSYAEQRKNNMESSRLPVQATSNSQNLGQNNMNLNSFVGSNFIPNDPRMNMDHMRL